MSNASTPPVRWDLSALFSGLDDPKIPALWEDLHARSDAFAERYEGGVARLGSEELRGALEEYEALIQDLQKPATYGSLRFAVEADNEEITAFMQGQSERSTSVRVKLLFFDIELKEAEAETFAAWLRAPELKDYSHYLQVLRDNAKYTLSLEEEAILEETAPAGIRAWVRLFEETLARKDFCYVNPATGANENKTESEVITMLRDVDRAVRVAAGDALTKGLQESSHLLTYIFNIILLDKRIDDTLRDRPYPEHARHMANELQKETVDLVMRLCKEYQVLVARYYRVKQQILGLPELTHIDRYAPLFDTKATVNWESGKSLVLKSFEEFSPTLHARAKEFFDRNWIDAEARKGKTGGAFCAFNTPDTHPVVMMSYLGRMDHVTTLAHELGHGVHASLSREQSLLNFHCTLPLAELASIFAEMVVFEELVKQASEQDRLALYAEKIEGIFASIFRQSAMFRFEQRCHQKRREEGELSGAVISEVWQDELQGMFGDSVTLSEGHEIWWSYIGHFIFAPFYVYAYSFGELLTLALYEKAKTEGAEFERKYIELLRAGGSKSPKDLMAGVGVDLDDESFWRGGFAVIERMIREFERQWAAYPPSAVT